MMQTQADLAGRRVLASAAAEMSALGVARMAAGGTGGPPTAREFVPAIDEAERASRRAAWSAAVARARANAPVEALR